MTYTPGSLYSDSGHKMYNYQSYEPAPYWNPNENGSASWEAPYEQQPPYIKEETKVRYVSNNPGKKILGILIFSLAIIINVGLILGGIWLLCTPASSFGWALFTGAVGAGMLGLGCGCLTGLVLALLKNRHKVM